MTIKKMKDTLAIVVPCFNEEEVLQETTLRLTSLLKDLIGEEKIANNSYILYVDDGSKDTTWSLIEKHHRENELVQGLKLACNVGHQNALFSGLMTAAENGTEMIVSIDADLQDDVDTIATMVDKYYEGNDIVYGVRDKRDTDTFLKRNTALMFYKVMELMGSKTINNHADFRLMSNRAVKELEKYEERNLYLRGIVPMIGYKTTCVYYDRTERFAGVSKYSPKKMIALALNGITSFSVKPMQMIAELGFVITGLSILAAIYSLGSYFWGTVIPGWTSLMLSLWFIGGLILLSLGIVGEYIGKIYIEVKHRPRYNIEKHLK